MGIVNRLVANKYLRTLKKGASANAKALADAKAHLVEIGPKVIPSVLELLPSPEARESAMEVLDRLLDNGTLPTFIQALGADRAISTRVTQVLSMSQNYDAWRLLDHLSGSTPIRSRIEGILKARGSSVPARTIVAHLQDAPREVQGSLFRLLEMHGDESIVGELLPLIEQTDPWTRIHTLRILANFGTEDVIEMVAETMKDENRNVRLQAVKAIGKIGGKAVYSPLCNALRDPDLKVQTAAIEMLIELQSIDSIPYLINLLKDESEFARRGAVEVMNAVATSDVIFDLVNALRDEDWWVRVRAADALGTLGGTKVVDAVLKLIDSDDEFIRRYAVEILIAVPDKRAVPHLIHALNDHDWWVRERAIDALAKTRDARAVEPIVDLMVRDEEAAPICARALGAIGDERAVDWLCEASVSGRADLEKEARAALKELGKGELSADSRARIREFQLGNRRAPLTMRGLTAPRQDAPATGAGAPAGPPANAKNDTIHAAHDGSSPGITDPAAAQGGTSPPDQVALNLQNLEYGTMLLNRYKVIRKIGAGGFGSVYLVEDTAVSEELILKVLNPQISMDRSIIRRFVLELKLTRRITHKNVIRLYDLLELGVGHAISMEYFPSTDLGRLIEREGALDVERGLYIAEQICAGLAVAHGEGIIHRDIKPPNILVGDDQMVKVVDFGLASVAQHTGSRLTKSGILIGTPQYMAPEQISGDTVDSRTDVYSLGVLMYEMFSGIQPFRGDNPVNILFQHLEGDIPPLTEVVEGIPAEINELVMRAMQRERDPRPADAQELLGLIEAIKA